MTIKTFISQSLQNFTKSLRKVFIKKSDIVNSLDSSDTDKPLAAYQGKVLNENVASHINSVVYSVSSDTTVASFGKWLAENFKQHQIIEIDNINNSQELVNFFGETAVIELFCFGTNSYRETILAISHWTGNAWILSVADNERIALIKKINVSNVISNYAVINASGVQNYNSSNNVFTVPQDGHIFINIWGNITCIVHFLNSVGNEKWSASYGTPNVFYVRKGMKFWFEATDFSCIQCIYSELGEY